MLPLWFYDIVLEVIILGMLVMGGGATVLLLLVCLGLISS